MPGTRLRFETLNWRCQFQICIYRTCRFLVEHKRPLQKWRLHVGPRKVTLVKCLTTSFVLLLLSANPRTLGVGQAHGSDAWTFRHYPAAADFKGTPAKPILATPFEHSYRTQIRAQARKGPNFAGHFTLAKWGCGSPCLRFVIIDATSGAVYDPSIIVGCANKYGLGAKIDFRLGSRLIAATGVSEAAVSSTEVVCGTNYHLWDGKHLKFVHFEPWPKSDP